MNPGSILETKQVIHSIQYERWQLIAQEALGLSSVKEIPQLFSGEHERIDFPSSEVGRFREISW